MRRNEKIGGALSSNNCLCSCSCYFNSYFASMGVKSMTASAEEHDRQAAETNRISAEGNRISAESDRAVADIARNDASDLRNSLRFRKDVGQGLAYVLIILVGVVGFYQMNKVDEHVCEAAEENRKAVRGLVVSLDKLGNSLISDGREMSELTKEELDALDQFEVFTAEQLVVLDIPVC